MKQSKNFKIGLIIDFDNTLFENKDDDWTVSNFTDERLKLRGLLKMSSLNYVDTILCSGRHVSQREDIDDYLRKYAKIPNWYALWEFSYDLLDENRRKFMIAYWNWKIDMICYFEQQYKYGVVVVDDDPVICNMCVKFNIPCVLIDHIHKTYIISDKNISKYLHDKLVINGIATFISGICNK